MSIRQVNCPGCGAAANVPAALTNIKCPSCATVWNVNNPGAAQLSPDARRAQPKPVSEDERQSSANLAIVGGLIGAGMFLLAIIGLGIVVLNRDSKPAAASAAVEETIKPREPEEYRVVDLPEPTRKRIYDDYRKVARTTVEKPLAVPQGTKIRQDLEVMLQKTFDRELMRFAALHDITVDDVKEVIKEGDAKAWDGSPRSHAVRDGKRVYAEEKSEGWKLNPNRK
jgi:ribosomal protein S27E